MLTYTTTGRSCNTAHLVRGFVASGDICGDLEIYSDSPIAAEDAVIKQIFGSYQLDEHYVPKYKDAFFYADVLYRSGTYKAAAPVFEMALAKLKEDPATGLKIDTNTDDPRDHRPGGNVLRYVGRYPKGPDIV